MNLCYPAEVRDYAAGTVGLFFPDVPEAASVGASRMAAIDNGGDALVVALSGYVEDGRPIPLPGHTLPGQVTVCVPPLVGLKLAIHDAMIRRQLTQAALAERLGVDSRQIRRILDLDHESKFSQIEAALAALGLRASVSVEENVPTLPV